MKLPAVVWGASGHAAVVADAAQVGSRYEPVGFIDEVSPGRKGEAFAGGRVLGGLGELNALRSSGVQHILLGVGDNRARLRIAALAEEQGFLLGVVLHPSAIVARDVQLGSGVFVAAGAVINPGAQLERAVIVNTRAVVEHHCYLAEGVHVAPGAVLAGNVRVGRLSWIGAGAVVIEKLEIGEETQLGAGSVVVRPLPSRVVAYGAPAVSKRPVGRDG